MYTRLVFEIQYFNSESDFECIVDLVKTGFSNCICIPGIAANYILNVMKDSFREFNGSAEVVWSSCYHRYIAICRKDNDELCFPNFYSESETGIFKDDVCEERSVVAEKDEADFAYIRIRDKSEIKKICNVEKDTYKIEKCLALLHEKDCNSKEIVSLFSYIAKEYRAEWSMREYLDKLFRLYFFLFPEICIQLIKKCSREADEMEFFEYNLEVLDKYSNMISKVNNNSNKLNIEAVSDFLEIDFGKVYTHYLESIECGEIKSLKDIINKSLNRAMEQQENIQEVRDNYCRYYMISIEKMC